MLYESERDRREQQEFADWFCERNDDLDMQYQMTDTAVHWDVSLFINGGLHALVEFKRRTRTSYPTLAIDVSKIDALVETSMFLKVTPLLVIKREDVGGYWGWICHKGMPKGKMKRIKIRGVPGETKEKADDVYHIPYVEFFRMRDPSF